MSYAAIDLHLRRWGEKRHLKIYPTSDGREVRNAYVSSISGEWFQIWVDAPVESKLRIYAACMDGRRAGDAPAQWCVDILAMETALDKVFREVVGWMLPSVLYVPPEGTTMRPDYPSAWRGIRVCNQIFWTVFLSYLPGIILISAAIDFLFANLTGRHVHPEMGVALCWWLILALCGLYSYGFRCPRCRVRFYRREWGRWNISFRKCLNCGVRIGTPTPPSRIGGTLTPGPGSA